MEEKKGFFQKVKGFFIKSKNFLIPIGTTILGLVVGVFLGKKASELGWFDKLMNHDEKAIDGFDDVPEVTNF